MKRSVLGVINIFVCFLMAGTVAFATDPNIDPVPTPGGTDARAIQTACPGATCDKQRVDSSRVCLPDNVHNESYCRAHPREKAAGAKRTTDKGAAAVK